MASLQVKNFPDDLHDKLRQRARAQHTTVSELVAQILDRELGRPTMAEWLESVRKLPKTKGDIDITALMDEIRGRPPEPRPARRGA